MEKQARPLPGDLNQTFTALSSAGASVADSAYRSLRSAIVQMKLPPGTRLTEQELADALRISRQPVREALLRLRVVGLVEARGQRGTFVTWISRAAVESAQFVREAIETAVVRRACAGLARSEVEKLREILARQQAAADEADAEAFFLFDEAFHRAFAVAVGCAPAWKTIEDVKGHMDRVRYLSLPQATPVERLVEQHQAILDSVLSHDENHAMQAMQEHLREIVFSLPVLAERHPGLFAGEDALSGLGSDFR